MGSKSNPFGAAKPREEGAIVQHHTPINPSATITLFRDSDSLHPPRRVRYRAYNSSILPRPASSFTYPTHAPSPHGLIPSRSLSSPLFHSLPSPRNDAPHIVRRAAQFVPTNSPRIQGH